MKFETENFTRYEVLPQKNEGFQTSSFEFSFTLPSSNPEFQVLKYLREKESAIRVFLILYQEIPDREKEKPGMLNSAETNCKFVLRRTQTSEVEKKHPRLKKNIRG